MKHLPLKNRAQSQYNVGVSRKGTPGGEFRQRNSFPLAGMETGIEDYKKGKSKMKKYKGGGQLESVLCNGCGKKLIVEDGIVREGMISVDHVWDFFSEKDGEIHHLDLCEECYDQIIGQFHIWVDVEEQTELM